MIEYPMDGWQASKIDTDYYADYDDTTESWGVFGNNSGFCYSNPSNEIEAMYHVKIMREKNNDS